MYRMPIIISVRLFRSDNEGNGSRLKESCQDGNNRIIVE